MKKSILAAVAVIFLVSACAGTVQKVQAVKKGVVEPAVDQTIDSAIATFCALPVETQLRAITRKAVTVEALVTICPSWRLLRDAMLGSAMDRLGIGPVINLEPPTS